METMQSNKATSWEGKKERLKTIFPAITDSDLHFNDGKEKLMIEKLAYKLGKSEDELRYIIHAVL
jgi:hypothetical protein